MAVKVIGRIDDTEHPESTVIHVQEGHLVVQHWVDNQTIQTDAIYAPEQWHSAEVVPQD